MYKWHVIVLYVSLFAPHKSPFASLLEETCSGCSGPVQQLPTGTRWRGRSKVRLGHQSWAGGQEGLWPGRGLAGTELETSTSPAQLRQGLEAQGWAGKEPQGPQAGSVGIGPARWEHRGPSVPAGHWQCPEQHSRGHYFNYPIPPLAILLGEMGQICTTPWVLNFLLWLHNAEGAFLFNPLYFDSSETN